MSCTVVIYGSRIHSRPTRLCFFPTLGSICCGSLVTFYLLCTYCGETDYLEARKSYVGRIVSQKRLFILICSTPSQTYLGSNDTRFRVSREKPRNPRSESIQVGMRVKTNSHTEGGFPASTLLMCSTCVS